MLRATGSDAFEIIPEGGIEVTTSITDTNSNGYVKELRLSTTTLSSSLDTRIDNLSSSVVYQSETSSMTVLSSSYALTASFALNAGGGSEGRTYIHTQSSASTTWTVTHNLGEQYPAIVVFDSSDNVIVPGTITAVNDTSFTVTFPSAQTGKVSATVGGGLPFVSASFVDYVLAVNNDIPYWKGGVISGSAQIILTGTTGYSTFSSSVATTTLNIKNRVDSIEVKTGSYATTGSNLFIGTQTLSGSILPSVDNLYDLGSSTHQWRDVYISSGSLYIDGTKVISSTTQELQITTDSGQSIKILENGTDSIILQTADGDVELKSSGDGDILLDPTNGKIMLKGPVEILNGQKIQSSVGGTPVVFANDIVVSGSIELTGTIDGIDLTSFSSSANTRLTNLESSGGSLNSFTASANTRLGALETQSGSINSFTASANTRLGDLETESGSVRFDLNSHISSANGRLTSIETSTGSLNSFSSSTSTRLSSIEISTGSLNSFTSSTAGSLIAIQTSTSSLNSFTSSTAGSLIAIQTSTSSLNSFTSSTNTRLGALETSTSSLNTFSSSTNSKLTSIETSTASLNSFTSSTEGSLIAIQTSTASLNSFSSSTNTRLGVLETESGSIRTAFNSYTSSNDSTNTTQNNRLTALETSTSSLNTFSSSTNTRLGALETESGSIRTAFNSYTSSNDGTNTTQNNRLTALETSTSSLNSFSSSTNSKLTSIETSTGSLNTFSSSTNTRVGALETESGSIRTAFNNYTSSNDGTNTTQNSRLTSLEGKTGSYATTGSNTFIGDQTITGSLFISQNLIVGGSSSINFVSQSTLNIGTNLITVNAQNPGTRFGGLAVIDSGSSPTVSGSMLFDSINDQWIFVHQAIAGSPTTSSVVLMGPESFNSLGSEIYPTTNRVVKSINSEHLGDSNISDTGTKVSINSNTEITGTFVATGTALVSGSAQISFNGITDKPTLVSGSSQITFLSISSIPSGLVSGSSQVLNGSGVWSGSAQLPSGTVSGSSQVLNGSGVWSGSAQLPAGVVSGSSQVLNGSGVWSGSAQLPSGVVSGSSQITYSSISGIPTGIVSGSSQVSFGGISGVPSGLVSGSSQVAFGSLSGLPSGIVSGSSQISFGSISGVPSGLVSGSSQVAFGSLSGLPSGLVSGSSQISFGSISNIPSGLVSGSSQISFGSISGLPPGLVSGSSQISIASTSGFGTYINQALLTTSTPTFSTVSATTFTGALSGNATTASSTQRLDDVNNYTWSQSSLPQSYSEGMQLSFVGPSAGEGSWQSYGTVINARTYSGGGGSLQMYVPYGPGNGGTALQVRFGDYSAPSYGNQWTAWKTLLQSDNYNSYAPTLTGGGASGTWGINITGNAATATSATDSTKLPLAGGTLTGDLRFNNAGYGRIAFTDNYHGLILRGNPNNAAGDITAGDVTSLVQHSGDFRFYRTNGSINEVYFQVNATAPYWRGNVIYHAGNIPTWNQNTSGTAGSISGFNNPTTSATANTIAYRDSGGDLYARYMFAVHFNQSGGNSENPTIGQIWTQNTTDNYCRKSTPAHFISQLGLITTSNIGSQSVSYANSAGSAPNASNQNSAYLVTPGEGNGLKFWASDAYKISMGVSSVYQYGTVTDYSIKTQMNAGDPGRGFTWGREGVVPIASLNATSGNMQLAGSLTTGGSILPLSNNSVNLGSASLGWANVYTNDLHLSNMNKPEGNDIDGTNGNWTIQEGAENLYIINNNNGKKYKISLEEI